MGLLNHNNNSGAARTHHGALDGGLVGGAGLGHVAENHHEKHSAKARAHGVGQPGTTTYTTTTTVPTPSTGDKIAGKIDVAVGKMTNNPVKVQEGEIKQTHGKAALGGVNVGGHSGTGRATRSGAGY